MTATLANLETLVTEQTAHYYAQGTAGEARAESRLFDAAIACGMPYDHADLHGWVAIEVRKFLTSDPACDEDEWEGFDGWGIDPETGRGEWVA